MLFLRWTIRSGEALPTLMAEVEGILNGRPTVACSPGGGSCRNIYQICKDDRNGSDYVIVLLAWWPDCNSRWLSSPQSVAFGSRSRSSPRKRWIYPICQGCDKVLYIHKANLKALFPQTWDLTRDEGLYLIYLTIVFFLESEKTLWICAPAVRELWTLED